MKKIERIREDYDIITEKDDSDTRKLTSLVRAGLFDQNKLPMLKRALQKDPSKLTMAERKALLELLDSLMSQVLHSQSVYSKVKQNVGSEVNEAIKDYYGVDTRPGRSSAVSERDMPTIIILKRKSIRVYPDNQKVGLYYSQYLDRYVAIPFGSSKQNVPFTAINEEIEEAVDYNAAYRDYKADNPDDDTKDKILNKPNKLRKFIAKKAAEGKVRSIHYSTRPNWLGGDKEKNAMKKAANKSFNDKAKRGEINPLDWAASHTGVAIGNAIHKGLGAVFGKKAPMQAPPPKVKKTKEAPAPTKAPATSSGQTHGERAYTKLKAMNLGAPATPKVTSTSGKASASFGGSISAPITAKVSAPKVSAPKVSAPKVTKPSREEKRISKLPGMGAQPTGDFKFPEPASKTKTASYNSQTTTARNLTPLENKTGTINPQKQLPRKRYAGIDPKVPGTGPQPTIGKVKSPGKRMLAKLNEKRQIEEDTPEDAQAKHPVRTYLRKQLGIDEPTSAEDLAKDAEKAKSWDKITNALTMDAGDPNTPLAAKALQSVMPLSRLITKPAGAATAGVKAATTKAAVGTAEKGAVKSSIGQTFKKGAARSLRTGAGLAAGAIGALGGLTTNSNDDAKYLTPAASNAKVKINQPGNGGGTKTGVDTRVANSYRKSFETQVKEETTEDDEKKKLSSVKVSSPKKMKTKEKKKTSNSTIPDKTSVEPKSRVPETPRLLTPAAGLNSTVKISAPKPAGVTTGVDARMRKYERDFYGQQANESVLSTIKTMVNENVEEMQLNIGENSIKINNTIARKIVSVHESLNKENRKKLEEMLNEGTVDSFKKLITFAARH